MGQSYQYLLSIGFKHPYFRDGQFKSLQVSFDQETSSLLKNLGIILKPFPGGAHFLVLNPELLKDENQNAPIRLFLDCGDTYFINYTELPSYSPSDTLLYFNNLSPIPNRESSGQRLHKEETIGQNEVASLSFGKIFPEKFEADKNYQFKDVFGNSRTEDDIRQSPNKPPHFVISNGTQGLLRIFADEHLEERAYYYPRPVWKKPLGVIEIYTGALFEQFNSNGKQEYSLNFDSKKIRWKYFLMDPTYKKFKDLSIIDRTKEQVFNPPQKQKVQEAEALVFESKEEIALSEFSEDNFQLVDQFDITIRSGKVVLKTLPRASPEQLYRENPSSPLYSHIYI